MLANIWNTNQHIEQQHTYIWLNRLEDDSLQKFERISFYVTHAT